MDQGIIKNLKVHYRRFLLRRRINAIDNKVDFEFNLLNALNLLKRAWKEVKQETLANCFRKAGFFIEVSYSLNSNSYLHRLEFGRRVARAGIATNR